MTENSFVAHIQQKVNDWREIGYKGCYEETLNILRHIKAIGFLHQPQIEAIETYIYLKEIVGNKPTADIFKSFFESEKDLLLGLGLSKSDAFEYMDDKDKIESLITERFGELDYANQIYALTMGAGKTILMATMMVYDFVLSFYHPKDKRFAKNTLVFAPDKTIIESLKEIKSFDYSKVLPKEYRNILLNIKYHYLEDVKTPLSVVPNSNYNVVVSNSHKIILKTVTIKRNLFSSSNDLKKQEIENRRLFALRQLKDLAVFVDEAHHSYGTTLEGALKKSRQTINYLHANQPLIATINMTGTPYVKNRMLDDVVYHFGLKEGIETGILKQVRFVGYGNVKSEQFIEEVIDNFWSEYGEKRLEGKLPKIAFYSANIEELQTNLKPQIEKILLKKKIPINKVLPYHTEAEENRDEFIGLDTEESQKQFILLVGKGTEGWNCRSLVSCALYRKPKSSVFVLQSSTRCLRSIGDNSTKAMIFLSNENYEILDRELKSNFKTSISEIEEQEQGTVEHTLIIKKQKKVKVKKILKQIKSVKNRDLARIKINLTKFKREASEGFIMQGGIFLKEDRHAEYQEGEIKRQIKRKIREFAYYEIIELINRRTHLPCLEISQILGKNGYNAEKLIKSVNDNIGILEFIIQGILANAFEYEIETSEVIEELELTRQYPFKINVEKGRSSLVVYKNGESEGKRLGFHINPYNFDSGDEKELFFYLRGILEDNEAVADIFFTGGVTNAVHNDFYFQYYSPDNQRIAKYFPDFLVQTSKGRYLVIEVKSNREKLTYEQNKKQYKGNLTELFDEVFAKEVGFMEFQQENKDFEYHIIFDASLQKQQQELLEMIKKV